jgi:hypothetical protein
MPDLEWDGSEWKDERMVFQGPKNDDKEWKREEQGLSSGPDDETRLFQGLRYEDASWKRDELEMLQGPKKIGEEPKMDGQQVIQGPVRKSGEWRRNTRGMFQGSNKAGSAKRREGEAARDFVWDEAPKGCGPETRRDQPLGGPGWPDEHTGGPGRRDGHPGGLGLRDQPPGDSAWRDEPPGVSVWGDQSRAGGARWREYAGGGEGGEPLVNRFRRELGKKEIKKFYLSSSRTHNSIVTIR